MLDGINSRVNHAKEDGNVPQRQKQNIPTKTIIETVLKNEQTINELCNILNWPNTCVFGVTNTGEREKQKYI